MKIIGVPFSPLRGDSWRSKLRGDTVADEYDLLSATTANDASLAGLDGDLNKYKAIFTLHATLDVVVGSGYSPKYGNSVVAPSYISSVLYNAKHPYRG